MAGLDGLRAVSVLAVIAYHLNLSVAPGGLLGVDVFFVLSGYLITDILVAGWDRTGRIDLKAFWIGRARRLLAALLVMLAAVVIFVALWDPLMLESLRDDVVAVLLYASNWWFVVQKVSYFAKWGPPSPLGHLWSLAVEEQFYLLWPLLLAFGLRFVKKRARLATGTLILAAFSVLWMAHLYHPGADPTRVYDGTDTRAFALLIGASAALALPSRAITQMFRERRVRYLDLTGAVALAAMLWFLVATRGTEAFLYRGGMGLLSVVTAVALIALAHPSTKVGRLLSVAPLRWVGVRSYGIYLWHYPVIVLGGTLLAGMGSAGRDVLEVAASLGLAALSWSLVEDPVRHGALGRLIEGVRGLGGRWWLAPAGRALLGLLSASAVTVAACVATLAGAVPDAPPSTHSVLALGRATSVTWPNPVIPLDGRPRHNAAPTPIPSPLPAGQGVTAVGDSVMVDIAPYLEKRLPGIVIDGVVGQQMDQAPKIIATLEAGGNLGHRVFILELGTNGPFKRRLLIGILRSLPSKAVVLVNTRDPRSWEPTVNSDLAWAAKTNPNTTLVNWYRASDGKGRVWFWPDGVHLKAAGAEVLAAMIAQAVRTDETEIAASPSRPAAKTQVSRASVPSTREAGNVAGKPPSSQATPKAPTIPAIPPVRPVHP